MAEKFKINVGVAFTIEDYSSKMHTGGDVDTLYGRFTYHNGDGISFTAGQVLYTEGAIGQTYDFFEITSQINQTLGSAGSISLAIKCQTMVTPGSTVTRTVSVGGSLPFNITLQFS